MANSHYFITKPLYNRLCKWANQFSNIRNYISMKRKCENETDTEKEEEAKAKYFDHLQKYSRLRN